MNKNTNPKAKFATIDELLKTTIPNIFSPPPTPIMLRDWFDKANISRFKSNPTAKRGGGPVYYSVSDVEEFFYSRTMPKSEQKNS